MVRLLELAGIIMKEYIFHIVKTYTQDISMKITHQLIIKVKIYLI